MTSSLKQNKMNEHNSSNKLIENSQEKPNKRENQKQQDSFKFSHKVIRGKILYLLRRDYIKRYKKLNI
ncbi:MAG: hypothetical protein PHC47_02025 [Clostridia bacterium]|nr:hypothetical protein [Clostridia bacterium]